MRKRNIPIACLAIAVLASHSLPAQTSQTNQALNQLRGTTQGSTATQGATTQGTTTQGIPGLTGQGNAAQGGVGSLSGSLGGTGSLSDTSGASSSQLAMLAMATESYPATPGDIYELGFFRATQTERIRLVVEGDYSINAGFFGRLDTKGQTFRQVKAAVEKKVADSYPGSSPQLLITSIGAFPVKVSGETLGAPEVVANGLSTLYEVFSAVSTDFSSFRTVEVSVNGAAPRLYDLHKALRKGDATQNPRMRPGDSVRIRRAERVVTLRGEVNRPGIWELLPGEGLRDLIEVFGEGAKAGARLDQLILTRKPAAGSENGQSVFVNLESKAVALPELHAGDSLRVAAWEEYLPVVYLDVAAGANAPAANPSLVAGPTTLSGAETDVSQLANGAQVASTSVQQNQGLVTTVDVAKPEVSATAANGAAQAAGYKSLRVPYYKGLRLSTLVRSQLKSIDSGTDLENSFVIRAEPAKKIAVNLHDALFGNNAAADMELMPEDRVVIPPRSFAAFVSGEVAKSGFYPLNEQSRLSGVVAGFLNKYSSIRDITVTGRNGLSATYDLFLAERDGDLSQNPIVLPGDLVDVKPAKRIVSISGEVKRPGTYQLLANDSLETLLESYARGFTEKGNPGKIGITRYRGDNAAGEALQIDYATNRAFELLAFDVVTVSSSKELLPVVWFEGAIGAGAIISTGAAGSTASTGAGTGSGTIVAQAPRRQALSFLPGDTLGKAARVVRALFSDGSDLEAAYLLRGEVRTPVDLSRALYNPDDSVEIALKADDRIVIPFKTSSVFVSGEVTKSAIIHLTVQTRLADAVTPLLTRYSSIRDIVVTSRNGNTATYDLFAADRHGDLAQNPFLVPGDKVDVRAADRIVSISGEVKRPGSYQLLRGETLKALVEFYADSFTEKGDPSHLSLIRYDSGEKIALNYAKAPDFELQRYDAITVAPSQDYLPVAWFEGAVAGGIMIVPATGPTILPSSSSANASGNTGNAIASSTTLNPTSSVGQRVAYAFYPGDTAGEAARASRKIFTDASDLAGAYILRGSAKIPVNLEKALYNPDPAAADAALQPDDRIVVPPRSLTAFVSGEVSKTGLVPVTVQTRLSDVVTPLLTRYSSVRDITVTSRGGTATSYDLFAADRRGDLTQNPYLAPGDKVQVRAADRIVSISGEVKRPGTYQLLPGETLATLVRDYAGGFTEKGNPAKITVIRYLSESNTAGEKLAIDFGATPEAALVSYDAVSVPANQDLLPVVWFEGAIGVGVSGSAPLAAQRVPYTFFPGETVGGAVRSLRKSFSEVSDLEHAYISRSGEKVSVNLDRLLYDRDETGDLALKPNDTIIVPFRQFFVTVSGAVRIPGRYPYVPDRTWEYYVGLAGGFNPDQNANNAFELRDAKNVLKDRAAVVKPEDNINALSNSALYNFYRWSSVLSTVLSLASVLLALLR